MVLPCHFIDLQDPIWTPVVHEKQIEISSLDLSALSMSPTATRIILLAVVFGFFQLIVFVICGRLRHTRENKSRIVDTCYSISLATALIGSMWLVDDLFDEAYLWASKMENFLNTGRFGIQLHDGVWAESSAGFIQYFVAAFFKPVTGLSPEQTLVGSSLFIYFLCLSVFYISFRLGISEKRATSVVLLALGVSPPLLLMASEGVDNVGSVTVCALWSLGALSIGNRSQKSSLMLLAASIAPLIRFELWVLIIPTAIILFVNELGDSDLSTLISRRRLDLRPFVEIFRRRRFVISVCVLITPILVISAYRTWAFDQVIPAMVQLKRPEISADITPLGVDYFLKTSGLSTLVLLLGLIWLVVNGQVTVLRSVLSSVQLVFIALVLCLYTVFLLVAIGSGGDYLGYGMARYTILPMTLLLVPSMFLLKRAANNSNDSLELEVNGMKAARALGAIFLVSSLCGLFFPESFKVAAKDMTEVQPWRATCEQTVSRALSQYLPGNWIVGTTELNGFQYNTSLRLLDLFGGADSRAHPSQRVPHPAVPLNIRFSLADEIQKYKPQVLWAWGSASCPYFSSDGSGRIYQSLVTGNFASAVSGVFETELEYFRLGSQNLLSVDYQPHIYVFDDEFGSKTYAVLLVRRESAHLLG
jgi:hypothetical protein